MKKTLITLIIVILAICFVLTGCFQSKETVVQEEVVFESENDDISISLTGYEYAPKSVPCFVIRFKAEKSTDRKLICTAYDVKLDGVIVEKDALYNMATFENSNIAEGSIAFGAIDNYDVDFENARQVEFEYNVRDANDSSFSYNGSASFELKSKE